MRELLRSIVADSKGWLELRAHARRALSVMVRKGVVESAAFRTVSGVGARVLVSGTWGFSSAASFERDDVLRAVRDAVAAAEASSSGRSKRVARLQDCELAKGDFRTGDAADLAAHSTEEKTALAVDTEARIRASSTAVRSAMTRYSEFVDRKWIVSPDGADVSRSRAAWRAVVAWSPVLLLWGYLGASSLGARTLFDADWGWPFAVVLLVGLTGCAWAVRHPARGPAERLTRTWIVPR